MLRVLDKFNLRMLGDFLEGTLFLRNTDIEEAQEAIRELPEVALCVSDPVLGAILERCLKHKVVLWKREAPPEVLSPEDDFIVVEYTGPPIPETAEFLPQDGQLRWYFLVWSFQEEEKDEIVS